MHARGERHQRQRPGEEAGADRRLEGAEGAGAAIQHVDREEEGEWVRRAESGHADDDHEGVGAQSAVAGEEAESFLQPERAHGTVRSRPHRRLVAHEQERHRRHREGDGVEPEGDGGADRGEQQAGDRPTEDLGEIDRVERSELARSSLPGVTISGRMASLAGSKKTPAVAIAKLSTYTAGSERVATNGTATTRAARIRSTATIRRRLSSRSTATPANAPNRTYGSV